MPILFFQIGAYSSLPGRPYSSMSGGYTGGPDPLSSDPLGLDNSQSYLGAGDGGMSGSYLRDTAISGYGTDGTDDSNRARFLASRRFVSGECATRQLASHSETLPRIICVGQPVLANAEQPNMPGTLSL